MNNTTSSFSELLKKSWDIYTNNFHFFLLLAIIFAFPFQLFSAYFNPTSFFSDDAVPGDQFSLFASFGSIAFVETVGALMSILVIIAVMRGTREALQHQPLNLRRMLVESFPLWLPAIVTSFLHMLFLIGLSLLFVIPGIIFAGYWIFTTAAVALSNKKYLAALQYSRTLVKGRWWEVAGRTVFCALILAPFIMLFLFPLLFIASGILHIALEAIALTVIEILSMFFSVFLTVYFLELEKIAAPDTASGENTDV